MINRIYISKEFVRSDFKSKERREALAFAILLKLKFRSSTLHYDRERDGKTKLRALAPFFRMGNVKLMRAIKNGLKFEYLRQEGNLIIANKVKCLDYHNYYINFDGQKNYEIKDIEKELEKAFVYCHIETLEYLVHKKDNPKNFKSVKQAKKDSLKLELYGIKEDSIVDNKVSYKTWATHLGVSRSYAISLIKEMVKEGRIGVSHYFEEIGDKDLTITDKKEIVKVFGGFVRGLLNPRTNKIENVLQLSNKYSLNERNNVKYLRA